MALARPVRAPLSAGSDAARGTTIGRNIQVTGRIEGHEDLRVQGRVEGSVVLSETLYVEAEGVVAAEVRARDVVISGVVIGNVSATDCITLNRGAKLIGDIAAPRLIISDGAAFRGNVAMTGEAAAPRERSRAAVARPRAHSSGSPAHSAAGELRGGAASGRAPQSATVRPAATVRAAQASSSSGPRDEESTVVVRHAALRSQAMGTVAASSPEARPSPEPAPVRAAAKPMAKKAPPRALVPARGKRKVTSRG